MRARVLIPPESPEITVFTFPTVTLDFIEQQLRNVCLKINMFV